MKVLILHPHLHNKGGAEEVVISLASNLKKRNYVTTLITDLAGKKRKIECEQKDILLKELGFKKYPQILHAIIMANKIVKFMKNADYTNPHNFSSYWWCVLAKKMFKLDVPVVWYCEEPTKKFYEHIMCPLRKYYQLPYTKGKLSKLYKKFIYKKSNIFKTLKNLGNNFKFHVINRIFDKFIVKNIDFIIANSNFTASIIFKIYNRHVDAVIWPTVIEHTTPPENPGNGDFIYIPSRFFPQKNIERAILALAKLKKSIKLIISGHGPNKKFLEFLIKEFNLHNRVKLYDYVSPEKLKYFLKNCKFVMAISFDEPFGMVPIKANAFSKAVIGANSGGINETVISNFNGIKVLPHDIDAIAEKINFYYQNQELIIAHGKNGQTLTYTTRTLKHFINKFSNFLEKTALSAFCNTY